MRISLSCVNPTYPRSSGLGQEEKAAEAAILGEAKVEEEGLKSCAPAVQYSLRRLVRGVASSREVSSFPYDSFHSVI